MTGQPEPSDIDPELEESLRDWKDLWSEFDRADVSEKFDLAERHVRHGEGFEPEHVFEFVNRLWTSGQASGQRVRYREFLELMRSERADAVKPELARLQWRLLQTYLLEGVSPPADEVAIVPALFHQSPEVIGAVLDMVMYHGEAEPLVESMVEEWPGIRDNPELLGGKSEYAWTTITLVVADAVQEGGTPEELFDRLSEVVDPLRRDGIRELLAHANGAERVDPEAVEIDVPEELMDVATRVAAELWGELLQAGSSLSTATLAFQQLEAFYRYLVDQEVGSVSQGRLTFPATAPGGFLRSASQRRFRDGYREGIFVNVLGRWLDYLQRRRFVDAQTYRELFPELPRDLSEAVEPIVEASSDPVLVEDIRRSATELGKRP